MSVTSLMKGNLCYYMCEVLEKFCVVEPLDRHLVYGIINIQAKYSNIDVGTSLIDISGFRNNHNFFRSMMLYHKMMRSRKYWRFFKSLWEFCDKHLLNMSDDVILSYWWNLSTISIIESLRVYLYVKNIQSDSSVESVLIKKYLMICLSENDEKREMRLFK